jgi:hypothetical protein
VRGVLVIVLVVLVEVDIVGVLLLLDDAGAGPASGCLFQDSLAHL